MSKILSIFPVIATLLSSALPSFAEDAPAVKQLPKSESTAKPILLKKLVADGEKVASGDLITITRPFEKWILRCDLKLSADTRLCSVQQVVQDGNAAVLWRFGMSQDDKPVIAISVPQNMVTGKDFRMGLGDLEKVISGRDWRCGNTGCVSVIPFDGPLQSAIMTAQSVKFEYTAKDEGGAESLLKLQGSMAGFAQAIDAGSKDPFGKTAVVVAPKEPIARLKKKDRQAAIVPHVNKHIQTAQVQPSHRIVKQRVVAVIKRHIKSVSKRNTQVAYYRTPLY